jgi:hypothetical protein
MTAEEMHYRAEVGYDFITGFSAAGISKKEWSLFLTTAQMDIVKKKLPVNLTDKSFEEVELLSVQFSELTKEAVDVNGVPTTTPSLDQSGGVSSTSIFYNIPDDFLYGVLEHVDYKGDDSCDEEKDSIITTDLVQFCLRYEPDVIPVNLTEKQVQFIMEKHKDIVVTYDYGKDSYSYYIKTIVKKKVRVKPINNNYYTINRNNPFKKPSADLAWRLKAKSYDGKKRHEIVAVDKVDNYYLKYLMVPPPIIIFDVDYQNDYDEIQGVVLDDVFNNGSSMDSVLNDSVCDTIVNRAIMIAQKSLGDSQSYQLTGVDSSTLN